jgi:hypothetical protein
VLAAAGAVLSGVDPNGPFKAAGGTGNLVTAAAQSGGALSTANLKVVVFDPRVTAIAVLGRGDNVAVAAAFNPALPFPAPVLAGQDVDPAVIGSLAVLIPPGYGTIPQMTLQRYRGSQLVSIGIAATAQAATEGAVLVQIKGVDRVTGPQIGYGLTYTLKIGAAHSYAVKTRPFPQALISRPFVAGPGFAGADKSRFLKIVGSVPPAYRSALKIIAGTITVSVLANTTPICGEETSCAGFDPGNGYFMMLNRAQLRVRFGHFVITHELGHLVDFLGLDTFSHQAFQALFTRSPKWKACYPVRGTCSPFLEVLADQFGYFGTNFGGIQSGYGDPRLAKGPVFAKLLHDQFAFRPPQSLNPLAGFGPLAKSFHDALHSGQGAL